MSGGGIGPCVDAAGQYGWRTEDGGPCVTTIPSQMPPLPGNQPPPGQPAPQQPGFCTLPDGSIGYRQTAGGPCISALQQLPGGIPGQPSPGTTPNIPTVPGMVTEQQCVAREAQAAAQAKRAEESNVFKYAAISAVASGIVGIGLGYLFK